MDRPSRFLLTGTPGSGKTTLIHALREQGHLCVDEPAREILAEQRAIGGTGLPEKDAARFVQLMLERTIEAYQRHLPSESPVFFDRGIPDMIAYAKLFGTSHAEAEKAARKYRYQDSVFFLPPWKAIYRNDDERKMTFEHAEEFSKILEATYCELGYRILHLPFASVDSRVKFLTRARVDLLP